MSGSIKSTGMLTNNGLNLLDIKKYSNKKIIGLTIHIIPLSLDKTINIIRGISTAIKIFTPILVNPSLTHIAIQIFLENYNDILIFEYGQYFSKESDLKNNFFSGSIYSSNDAKEINNKNIYYYINKDGARITIFTNDYLNKIQNMEFYKNKSHISRLITDLIKCQYYNISYEFYRNGGWNYDKFGNSFERVECDVNNKITVNELIEHFKGEKWEAKEYNAVTHNCQDFGAEIINVLKAIRRNEEDKIRVQEKIILPGCIISSLWHNEKLSITNTLGRIPIFGFLHDCFILLKTSY